MHMCFMLCFKRDSIVDEIHWEPDAVLGSRLLCSSSRLLGQFSPTVDIRR